MNTEHIISKRQNTHGSYAVSANMADAITLTIEKSPNWSSLPAGVRNAFRMIAVKLARAACGDWKEKDHYADISGYAVLALRSLPAEPGVDTPES
jgi:hypothetical protein